VLVVASLITELIDRNFGRAALCGVVASLFSWFGLMHSPIFRWDQPAYAAGCCSGGHCLFSTLVERGCEIKANHPNIESARTVITAVASDDDYVLCAVATTMLRTPPEVES